MVFGLRTLRALVLASMICLCLMPVRAAVAASATATPYIGRSLADALRGLESAQRRFLFSSQLLPEDLRVTAEPPSGDALSTARALLAANDLALSEVAPGLYAVVRRTSAPVASSPSAALTDSTAAATVEPLSEVAVWASRYRIAEATPSMTLLDAQTLRTQPGFGDDALRSLQRLPGLVHDGFSARSNIRGGDTSETLLLLDGYPLRQPFHIPAYHAFFSAIDSQLIEEAEVYTGGFPARYGNRMSGVFDLHTIDALAAPRRSFALDFFNASGRVSGGRESQQDQPGYDWLVSARVGTLRPLLNLVDPDVGQPGYTDGYARAGWGDPDGLRITANLLVSRDELAIAREPRAEQGDIENRARYLWLRADNTWGPNLRASLMLGQTRMESLREGASNEPLIALGEVQDRRASRATDLRGNVVWQWRANHLLEAGFELKDEDARYRYEATAVFAPQVAALFNRDAQLQRDIELNPTRQRGALFASWRWRMSDSITTEVGGRAQRLLTRGQGTEWISEPRLGLSWQALPDTRLQLAWGRFTQIDEIDELAIEDGVQQLAAPQRSEHLIAGIEQRLTPEVGLRLEVFRKLQTSPRTRYENLLDTQSLFPEIAPDRVAISPDRAELSGVELSANYDATALHVWGTLGWSRSQDRINAGMWAPRSWDQRWMASGGAMWTQGRWLFSGQLDVHEGWPRTHLFRDTQGDLQLGPRNGNRLETFAQLNLRAQYTRPMALGELTFIAQLMNATNWRNECCTELVIVDGELTGRPQRWLPIIPSLGLRWSF